MILVKPSKLLKKALLIFLSIFIFMSILICSINSWVLYQQSLSEYEKEGSMLAKSIADTSVDLILNRDAASIQAKINELVESSNIAYIIVHNDQNEIIAHTFVPEIPAQLQHLQPSEQAHTQPVIHSLSLPTYEHKIIDITVPILFGEVGFVNVGMDTTPIISTIFNTIKWIFLITFLLFLISTFIIYLFMINISKPLHILHDYALNLAEHNFLSPLPLQKKIKILAQKEKESEIGSLATAFVSLEEQLIKYIDNLKKTVEAKKQIESEMKFGKEIQMSMIPKLSSLLKTQDRQFQLGAYIQPAKHVGGDFYDFNYDKTSNRLFFFLGDVSGKGLGAAIFMAMTQTLFRASITQQGHSMESVANTVNKLLCEQNRNHLFVTVFLGVLDLASGQLTYVNVGHCPPLLLKNTGQIDTLALTGGMALGVDSEFSYSSKQLKLSPHDQVLIFSDGATDARNTRGQILGEDGFYQFVLDKLNFGAQELVSVLTQDLHSFIGNAEQADDIALLSIQWGKKNNNM